MAGSRERKSCERERPGYREFQGQLSRGRRDGSPSSEDFCTISAEGGVEERVS